MSRLIIKIDSWETCARIYCCGELSSSPTRNIFCHCMSCSSARLYMLQSGDKALNDKFHFFNTKTSVLNFTFWEVRVCFLYCISLWRRSTLITRWASASCARLEHHGKASIPTMHASTSMSQKMEGIWEDTGQHDGISLRMSYRTLMHW